MKRIIACSALLIAGAAFAQTTSTTKVDVANQSILERMGGYYYGAIEKGTVSKEEGDKPDTSFVNYLNASFKLTNDSTLSTTFRFVLEDSLDRNQKQDTFNELDQRVGISTALFKKGMFSVRSNFTVELPTSKGSQESNKIARVKPALSVTTKFDDYNSVMTWLGWNRDIRPEATASVDSTSRSYLTPWIVYNNSYLSEKYVFKAEYSGSLSHIPGSSDLTYRKNESDVINVGTEFSVAGVSLNPYAIHYVSKVKALNKMGAGINLFKSF